MPHWKIPTTHGPEAFPESALSEHFFSTRYRLLLKAILACLDMYSFMSLYHFLEVIKIVYTESHVKKVSNYTSETELKKCPKPNS